MRGGRRRRPKPIVQTKHRRDVRSRCVQAVAVGVACWLSIGGSAAAAENLTLASGLSFTDDSSDAFPIRGDRLADADIDSGRPTVVFFGASHCWNTNREAERLVALYPKFHDRVRFIVVDVNHPSAAQRPLLQTHYRGSIPTLVIFAANGAVLYSRAGETAATRGDTSVLDRLIGSAVGG